MPWFKVDDQLDANKKVRAIPRRNRTKAIGLWTLAGAFSARELTDGFIPNYMLSELGGTENIAAELVRVGMWEVVEGGWNFVHWDEFQPTSDEVRAKRANDAERQARHRKNALSRRSKSVDQQKPEDVTVRQVRESRGESQGESRCESALPDPTRPDPTYREPPIAPQRGASETPPPAAPKPASYPPAFTQWWDTYPRRQNASKKQAYAAWRDATRTIDPHTLTTLTATYATNPGVDDPRYIPHPHRWLKDRRWEAINDRDATTRAPKRGFRPEDWLPPATLPVIDAEPIWELPQA